MMLPDGWKQGRLGGLCSIEIGGTPSRGVAAYWDSAHDTSNVWVSIRDMRQRLITRSAEQISNLGVKKSNVKLQHPGTVLLSFKLSIGRVAIAAVPLFTNEAIAGLSPTGLTRDFLFHGLQGWDLLRGVDQAIKGATLNKQKLKNILFEYPESEREQSKIAEVLSTADRMIEQTEALITKHQRIKTGLMQDLLARGIDEHGNLRSEQTHEFKDSPLGRIPVEWECASFGDCWRASPQNGLYKPQSQYSDDGTPIIRIDGFRNGDLIDHQTFRRVRLAPAESRTFALEAGDLLVNRVNSIEWLGKAALVGSLAETTVFESNMMRIRVDHQWLIPEFAILLLISPHAYHHFRLCAKTAIAQASINQEDARSLFVALPHRVEQQRIVDTVQAAHRADGRLRGATLKLRLLKTGLMQDLLTGNRRVTLLLEQCEKGHDTSSCTRNGGHADVAP